MTDKKTALLAPALFNFGDHRVRVVELDGNPWFVAADVCRCLGMDVSKGTFKWIAGLAADEKQTHRVAGGIRGNPSTTLITESGLYKLVLRSDRPEAAKFQDWVTREVLPAIRKDGAYIVGEEQVRTGELSEDEFILKAMNIMAAKIDRLRAERDAYAADFSTVSIAQYVASNRTYVGQSARTKLAHQAKKLAEAEGIALTKEPRKVETAKGIIDTTVTVYPRSLLDRVAKVLGILAPRSAPGADD